MAKNVCDIEAVMDLMAKRSKGHWQFLGYKYDRPTGDSIVETSLGSFRILYGEHPEFLEDLCALLSDKMDGLAPTSDDDAA